MEISIKYDVQNEKPVVKFQNRLMQKPIAVNLGAKSCDLMFIGKMRHMKTKFISQMERRFWKIWIVWWSWVYLLRFLRESLTRQIGTQFLSLR